MLDSMTRQEWVEWQVFLQLEPLASTQMADRMAAIALELRRNGRIAIAAAGGKLHDAEPTLEQCRLRFGDDLPPGPTRGNWRTTKANLLRATTGSPDGVPREPRPRRSRREVADDPHDPRAPMRGVRR